MKTIIAMYDELSEANATVRELIDNGIPRADISLMASDSSGNYQTYLSGTSGAAATAAPIEGVPSGAATGAGIGAILGGLGGLLVGLGVLVIPGIGPVLAAGPLATAITALTGAGVGALAGGAAGGLVGALVDLGLPEETASYYAEGVKRGGVLMTVRAEDHQAEDVRRIMNRHNVVNIDERVRSWRDQGWSGYDPGAPVASYNDDDRFTRFNTDFERHYTTTYGTLGKNYDFYRPAYHYGYQLAGDDRYRDWTWDDLEPEARREWGQRYSSQGAWEDFKDAVQYSWMRVKQGIREVLD